MKFIIQNISNNEYMTIDTISCTSQDKLTTLHEATVAPLTNTMTNMYFCYVEDERIILQAMKRYPEFRFIQFVYDIPTPYEFW